MRISNNGEFTHSAPWSVAQQGKTNVLQGCINLSPSHAKAVFDAVLPGDPVEITGSSQQLGPEGRRLLRLGHHLGCLVAKSALRS